MNEVFYWKGIPVLQNQEVLKIGTDAILLGSWISHLSISPHSILDVGSGTGILSLMMAHTFPDAHIDAIDLQEEAVTLTRHNFISGNWKGRLKVFQQDVLNANENASTHDLVLCNPPFYFNQLIPEDTNRKVSRHTIKPANEWMKALASRCNQNGLISLVVPYHLSQAWVQAGNTTGVFCQVRLNVYSFRNDPEPIRTLVLFGQKLKPLQIERLIIYESPGQYTKEYRDFTGL